MVARSVPALRLAVSKRWTSSSYTSREIDSPLTHAAAGSEVAVGGFGVDVAVAFELPNRLHPARATGNTDRNIGKVFHLLLIVGIILCVGLIAIISLVRGFLSANFQEMDVYLIFPQLSVHL
jgi:hypothetical protein